MKTIRSFIAGRLDGLGYEGSSLEQAKKNEVSVRGLGSTLRSSHLLSLSPVTLIWSGLLEKIPFWLRERLNYIPGQINETTLWDNRLRPDKSWAPKDHIDIRILDCGSCGFQKPWVLVGSLLSSYAMYCHIIYQIPVLHTNKLGSLCLRGLLGPLKERAAGLKAQAPRCCGGSCTGLATGSRMSFGSRMSLKVRGPCCGCP